MKELYNKLKQYSISDAIKIEESDRQYIALENFYSKISDKNIYLSLILVNALICYQLSWKWEDYWKEFSDYFSSMLEQSNSSLLFKKEEIIVLLSVFIKQSKNNKRFIDTKIKRLKKIKPFLEEFIWKEEYYYDNMEKLRDDLAKTMKQKIDAKTIVFAVKMFSYWARNKFSKLNYFPTSINIPVDSRLINLFEKYKKPLSEEAGQKDIKKFYFELSNKLGIPELHLDAILWVNYDELI